MSAGALPPVCCMPPVVYLEPETMLGSLLFRSCAVIVEEICDGGNEDMFELVGDE